MEGSRQQGVDRTGRDGVSLPRGWDFGRDLAVLVGAGYEARASWLLERGQARLLVLVPGDPGEAPDGVTRVDTEAELTLAILRLRGPQPAHVVVLRTADPRASAERHREVARGVQAALRSRQVQLETVARSGLDWLRQGIANLAPISDHPSIDALRASFHGRPCVLISPGPSLAQNVGELPGLRGRALLVAGSHSLGALERVGVTPDLLVLADPGDLIRHLRGIDVSSIPALVVAATCRREVFELPARRLFSFAGNGALDGWIYEGLGEDAALATGGSVACSALSLALALECDPIVLVGQDLSFSPEGFYAPGTVDGDAEVVTERPGSFSLRKPDGVLDLREADGTEVRGEPLAGGGVRLARAQELVHLPGYHGGTVISSRAFQAFHSWFEAVALSLEGRVRIVNATEGGARIRGMEQVPLREATAGWPPLDPDVEAVLDRASNAVDPAVRRARLSEHVGGMLAALEPCLGLARRCSDLAATGAADPARLDELERAEKELSRALRPVRLFSLVAQDRILAAQERARLARDLAENLAAARELFDVVARSVELLRAPLEEARRELAGEEE